MDKIFNGQDQGFGTGRTPDTSSGRGSLRGLPWLVEEGTFEIEIRSALHREGEGEYSPWALAAIEGVTTGGSRRRVSFAVSLPVRGGKLSRKREEIFMKFVRALGLERGDGTPGLEEPVSPRFDGGMPFYPQLSGRRIRARLRIDGTRADGRTGARIPTYILEDVLGGDTRAGLTVSAQPPAAGSMGEALAPVFDRLDAAVRRAVGEAVGRAVEEAVGRVLAELRDANGTGQAPGSGPEGRGFGNAGRQAAARPSVITMPDDLDFLDGMVPDYAGGRDGK